MGCRYEWADESHLILNVYIEHPWTWQEYDALSDEMFPMLRETGHPCATAVDVSKMGSLPPGNALASLSRVERMMPPNMFVSALVGAPYVASVFMNMLMRLRPNVEGKTIFARTLEEAHQKIRERYQKNYASFDEQNNTTT